MKVGDKVTRMLGDIPCELIISELTEDKIICGPWIFDRKTLAEIDEELGWGPQFGCTGSYLVLEENTSK